MQAQTKIRQTDNPKPVLLSVRMSDDFTNFLLQLLLQPTTLLV